MKKIFMASYGGGHANIIKNIYWELRREYQDSVCITCLGLTAAVSIFKDNHIPYITMSEAIRHLDCYEDIMTIGRRVAQQYHTNGLGIALCDTEAYYGTGIYDLIQSKGETEAWNLFKTKGRKAFLPVSVMKKVLQYYQPDVVVITASPRTEKACGIAADLLEIPVIRINDLPVNLDHIGHKCRLCVMNEWAKKNALQTSGLSPESIYVTGQPVFEENNIIENTTYERVKQEIHFDAYAYHVVLFTRNGVDQSQIINDIYDIAKDMPDVLFVIKLHPNQLLKSCTQESKKQNNVHMTKERAKEYLQLADLVITEYSTTGLEATLLGKPLIVNNYYSESYELDYVAMGIAEKASSKEELQDKIVGMLDRKSDIYNKYFSNLQGFHNKENAAKNICRLIMDGNRTMNVRPNK